MATTFATPAYSQTETTHLSAIDLFRLADGYRDRGKTAGAIAIYDALAKDPNADIRAEARFRKGMMLAGLKRYSEAAEAFREVLNE